MYAGLILAVILSCMECVFLYHLDTALPEKNSDLFILFQYSCNPTPYSNEESDTQFRIGFFATSGQSADFLNSTQNRNKGPIIQISKHQSLSYPSISVIIPRAP
jgi:hypothetical protein